MKHHLRNPARESLSFCGDRMVDPLPCLRCGGGPVISKANRSHSRNCGIGARSLGREPCLICAKAQKVAVERERRRACKVWPDDMGKITQREEEAVAPGRA